MTALNAKGSLVAGVLAAIGASVCCVGPLVFLGLAFRKLYLVPQECTPGMQCADARIARRQRLIFWSVTVLLFGLLAVPWVAPLFY